MSPLEIVEARLAELRKIADAAYEQRGALIDKAAAEKRGMTDDEQAVYDAAGTKRADAEREIGPLEARATELRDKAKAEAVDAAARVELGQTGEQRSSTLVKDPDVYARGNVQRSYFRDLAKSQLFGDADASERLRRHAAAAADVEVRALGNTNTTGGSGGEMAPPLWLVQDYVKLARPGRVTADLFKHSDVPRGVSSVNLPRIITGTTVALQGTQNTALSQTDITTGAVSTGFSTVGGKQVVSQQLLDQSEINFDQVITSDLAAAYAQNIGTQVLTGAGTGANNNSVVNGLTNAVVPAANVITFTSAAPTAALFYSKAAGALAAFAAGRYMQPTVWVMHPRRWFWLLAQVDSSNRPLVVPNAVAFNPIASTDGEQLVSGTVGTFLGLPVAIDPLMPTNFGAGTNQDRVYLLKQDDLWLFESPTTAEVFREPYADSMGVLFRLYSYLGTILNRQAYSIAYIDGTGLTPPAF